MANINKNQIGYEEVLTAGTANALMVQYKRANAHMQLQKYNSMTVTKV